MYFLVVGKRGACMFRLQTRKRQSDAPAFTPRHRYTNIFTPTRGTLKTPDRPPLPPTPSRSSFSCHICHIDRKGTPFARQCSVSSLQFKLRWRRCERRPNGGGLLPPGVLGRAEEGGSSAGGARFVHACQVQPWSRRVQVVGLPARRIVQVVYFKERARHGDEHD